MLPPGSVPRERRLACDWMGMVLHGIQIIVAIRDSWIAPHITSTLNASVEVWVGTSYKHGAGLADTWHRRQQQKQLQAGGSEEGAYIAPFPPQPGAEKHKAEEEAGSEEGQGDDSCPKQRAASKMPPGSRTEGSRGEIRRSISGGHDDTAGTNQGLRTLHDSTILEAGDVILTL